jgi:hypothetical protein
MAHSSERFDALEPARPVAAARPRGHLGSVGPVPCHAPSADLTILRTRYRSRGALSHGSTGGSRNPNPICAHPTVSVRASQPQHLVQDMNGDADLGRPTLILARAHPPSRARSPVTDDLLVAPDGGLNAAPFVVAGHLLPPDPAFLGNALEMTVALGWLTRRRCTGYRRRTRRHDDRQSKRGWNGRSSLPRLSRSPSFHWAATYRIPPGAAPYPTRLRARHRCSGTSANRSCLDFPALDHGLTGGLTAPGNRFGVGGKTMNGTVQCP